MTKKINMQELISTCDTIAHRCIEIAGTRHGSAWLLLEVVRLFEKNEACTAVTIPVYINAPVMKRGFATIGRDGSLKMATRLFE